MNTITIGDQQILRIGLGCMGMSDFYNPPAEAQSIALIHHALEQGVHMFDTADMYGPWKNERLLGRALVGRRENAFVATKFGVMRNEDGAFLGINGRPEYVKQCCEASLQRLGLDFIDLYYQHRVDPTVAIEETVGAMAALVQEGKIRHIGLSEAHPNTLRRAAKIHRISALQTEYSLWSREPEQELLELCAGLGVAFVAYSPLGRGFLSGKLETRDDLEESDFRRMAPRFQEENFQRNLELVKGIKRLAEVRGCTAAQMALAWVLHRGEHIMAIPGTTKKHRLDENIAALAIQLSDEELGALDLLAPVGAAVGDRYDARGLSSVNG